MKKDIPAVLTNAEAKIMYSDFSTHYVLTADRLRMLLIAAEALQTIRKAEAQIVAEGGDLLPDRNGAQRINPLRRVVIDANKQMLTALRALKLDERDRREVQAAGNPFNKRTRSANKKPTLL